MAIPFHKSSDVRLENAMTAGPQEECLSVTIPMTHIGTGPVTEEIN